VLSSNALMDSSVLHHVNHNRSFENSATAQYYFDLDEVQLSLPANGESSASQSESSIPMLTRGSNDGNPHPSFSFVRTRNDTPCPCRRLGQRLVTVKTSRFSRKQFRAAPEPTAESDLLTEASMVEEDEAESSRAESYHALNIVSGMAASTA